MISLKFSGEAQPEELSELEEMLKEHPDMQLRARMMEKIWAAPPENTTGTETSFSKHMQRLSNHFSEPALQYEEELPAEPEEKTRRPLVRRLSWITGIAAVLVMVWYIAYREPAKTGKESALAQNTVSTKKGSKSKIQLPDGTEVWLNADSKITYNEKFQGNIREVQLSGEAFFDVVRDESRPFIIHTDVIDVKVLGTAFNVRSYADEKNTETSLIRGLVEVTLRSNPDKKFTLKPNDKLIVKNDKGADDAQPAGSGPSHDTRQPLLTTIMGKIKFTENESSALETLWVSNKLAFDKEPLADIAGKIERWYDVKVKITGKELKEGEYSGVFENESLEQVMEALQLSGSGDFNYSINKKEVTIYP